MVNIIQYKPESGIEFIQWYDYTKGNSEDIEVMPKWLRDLYSPYGDHILDSIVEIEVDTGSRYEVGLYILTVGNGNNYMINSGDYIIYNDEKSELIVLNIDYTVKCIVKNV